MHGGGQARRPQFFTRAEFALVDRWTEQIIPADDHSPGASAAGVAAYIDRTLAESRDSGARRLWKNAIRRMRKTGFNERDPFFKELKERTVHAYYTSKTGIHDELEYKGNVILKEFSGSSES